MKKGKLLKRGIASLLVAVLAVGLLPVMPGNIAVVKAADGDKTIAGLGTGMIADPAAPADITNEWQGSYVYFGNYDTDGDGTAEPVKYRVLDSETSVFGGTTMLLDCDSILWTGSAPSSKFDDGSKSWSTSYIKRYLNSEKDEGNSYDYSSTGFLTTAFSAAEQSAIASSVKSVADSTDGNGKDYLSYVSLNNDKIFFLDAKEVTNTSYGYSNVANEAENRKKTGGNVGWWLRSAFTLNDYSIGIVWDGSLYAGDVYNDTVGVSPAVNINLSSVLFSSVISGTVGETGAEYKLTLLDGSMGIQANGTVVRNGKTVKIPYTIIGNNSGNASQVSVLVLDKEYTVGNTNNASILDYQKLNVAGFSASGTGTYTLPDSLYRKGCGSDYYMYILAEDVNSGKETDYAGEPKEITMILDEIDTVTIPKINAPTPEEALTTEVTINSTGVKETAALTWKKVTAEGTTEVTGNAEWETTYKVYVTLTAAEGYSFTDATGVTGKVSGEAGGAFNAEDITMNDDGTLTVYIGEYTGAARKTTDADKTAADTKCTSDDGKAVYRVSVSSLTNGTVAYVAPTNKKAAKVTVPDTVVIAGVTYKVTAIEKNAFKNNKKLKTLKLGKNVTAIGSQAFYGCKNLKTVTIGKNVSKIGSKAFYGCGKLKTLIIKSEKLTTGKIGKKAFSKTSKSMTVKVPKKKYKSYKTMLIKRGVNKKAKFKKI